MDSENRTRMIKEAVISEYGDLAWFTSPEVVELGEGRWTLADVDYALFVWEDRNKSFDHFRITSAAGKNTTAWILAADPPNMDTMTVSLILKRDDGSFLVRDDDTIYRMVPVEW